ncbi:hypothetical protein ACIRG5_24500 [Lentzea sp. NPDC102401]|uniref:hypothetical protein n=1 Tax=Lentzea sp. NPDC102401 TaxID=3364128 RepID=UPI0037F42E2A
MYGARPPLRRLLSRVEMAGRQPRADLGGQRAEITVSGQPPAAGLVGGPDQRGLGRRMTPSTPDAPLS